MFKNLIISTGKVLKHSTVICMNYHKINQKLQKKFIQNILLNQSGKKVFYINKNNYIAPKLLPLIINYTSGIYQPSPAFLQHKNIIEMISKILHKMTYILFNSSPIKTKSDLFLCIEPILQTDTTLDNIYTYPIIQHIITSIFATMTCPKEVLENLTENLIDYNEFNNYPISAVSCIEATVARFTLLDIIKKNKNTIQVIAQNPQNENSKNVLNSSLSYKQGKQPVMDFRVHNYCIETFKNKTFFYDSKLFANPVQSLSLTKGFMSLCTSKNIIYLMQRFSGDLLGSVRAHNVETSVIQLIKSLVTDINNVALDKKLSLQDKELFFQQVRDQILFGSRITVVIPSIIEVPPINISYNKYITMNALEYNITLEDIKNHLTKEDLINQLIPAHNDKQQANVGVWHDLLLTVICKYPQPLKTKLLENYHKFKLLEYSDDF